MDRRLAKALRRFGVLSLWKRDEDIKRQGRKFAIAAFVVSENLNLSEKRSEMSVYLDESREMQFLLQRTPTSFESDKKLS